ncbi:MAG: large-conductance mechanosensitive channel protein MscL [Chitinophagaceae bacterium]
MGMLKEFKEFVFRGNVIDLAVGIVIGAAFGAIVTAVVDNILMPIVGLITGGIDFKSLMYTFGKTELKYGMFIQATVTFLIIAFFLFLVIKIANRFRVKEAVEPSAPPPPTTTELLLMEIRDSLKANNRNPGQGASSHSG